MSPFVRAYAHGTIMVLIGCVITFLSVLAQQYDVARMMVVVIPLLGSLVAAIAAPSRRFLVGVSLLPVIGAALFALIIAWNSVVPLLRGEGLSVAAAHALRGMSPVWVGASALGAAIGWVVKRRRALPPNTSLERTRER
jgi:hypothetical protein